MHPSSCFESLHLRSSRLCRQSDAGGNSESQKDGNESGNAYVKFACHFPSTKVGTLVRHSYCTSRNTGRAPVALLIQIVHFHESNSGGVAYTADNGRVVAWWQIRNDC